MTGVLRSRPREDRWQCTLGQPQARDPRMTAATRSWETDQGRPPLGSPQEQGPTLLIPWMQCLDFRLPASRAATGNSGCFKSGCGHLLRVPGTRPPISSPAGSLSRSGKTVSGTLARRAWHQPAGPALDSLHPSISGQQCLQPGCLGLPTTEARHRSPPPWFTLGQLSS